MKIIYVKNARKIGKVLPSKTSKSGRCFIGDSIRRTGPVTCDLKVVSPFASRTVGAWNILAGLGAYGKSFRSSILYLT